MILRVFVVLILTQSYIANLASLLKLQQLQPTITDLKCLLKTGDYVGYVKNSHVYELLKELSFDESKLKVIKSIEECKEALPKGSANGGVAAVDETPILKLFVAKYCSKYTMIGPIFKTGGYGFVRSHFPSTKTYIKHTKM